MSESKKKATPLYRIWLGFRARQSRCSRRVERAFLYLLLRSNRASRADDSWSTYVSVLTMADDLGLRSRAAAEKLIGKLEAMDEVRRCQVPASFDRSMPGFLVHWPDKEKLLAALSGQWIASPVGSSEEASVGPQHVPAPVSAPTPVTAGAGSSVPRGFEPKPGESPEEKRRFIVDYEKTNAESIALVTETVRLRMEEEEARAALNRMRGLPGENEAAAAFAAAKEELCKMERKHMAAQEVLEKLRPIANQYRRELEAA